MLGVLHIVALRDHIRRAAAAKRFCTIRHMDSGCWSPCSRRGCSERATHGSGAWARSSLNVDIGWSAVIFGDGTRREPVTCGS